MTSPPTQEEIDRIRTKLVSLGESGLEHEPVWQWHGTADEVRTLLAALDVRGDAIVDLASENASLKRWGESLLKEIGRLQKVWKEVDTRRFRAARRRDAWKALAKRQDAEIRQIAHALFEPPRLPRGMTPLMDRILGAIKSVYMELADARTGEHEAWTEVRSMGTTSAPKVSEE